MIATADIPATDADDDLIVVAVGGRRRQHMRKVTKLWKSWCGLDLTKQKIVKIGDGSPKCRVCYMVTGKT